MKRNKPIVLIITICIVISTMGIVSNAQAATAHSQHTADCYNGSLHAHSNSCYRYSKSSTSCPACKGSGYEPCRTCYRAKTTTVACGGTFTTFNSSTASGGQCGNCGGGITNEIRYAVCGRCSRTVTYWSGGGCNSCNNSGGAFINGYTSKPTTHTSYSVTCSSCNGTGYDSSTKCYLCNGAKIKQVTCTKCNGSQQVDCSACTDGKLKLNRACTSSDFTCTYKGMTQTASGGADYYYYTYEIKCSNCKRVNTYRGIEVSHPNGYSTGAEFNGSSGAPYMNNADAILSYYKDKALHNSNGSACPTCYGGQLVTCTSCTSGKQYISGWCNKYTWLYYKSDGTKAEIVCNLKAKTITPKTKTQTIVR